jgi:hypothetical protein
MQDVTVRRHRVSGNRVAAAQAVGKNLLQFDPERPFAVVAENQFRSGRLAEHDALGNAWRDAESAPPCVNAFQQQSDQQARCRYAPQVRPGIVLPLADDSEQRHRRREQVKQRGQVHPGEPGPDEGVRRLTRAVP